MKTIPPPCLEPEVGPSYWRSLDQLSDTGEFRQWLEREFPDGASEFSDPVSRRHFVKIMSASFLLAGMGVTGCRKPVENILPFSKMPEGYVHGVPQFYATSRPIRGTAVPLLVKSNDGRPSKIEGNPSHPTSNGGTDAATQASILNLYDPDRAMRFAHAGNMANREQALGQLSQLGTTYAGKNGQGLAFLMDHSSSPTRQRLQQLIAQKLPQARWYSYEPTDLNVQRQAVAAAFGHSAVPQYDLAKATRILSLDCDFLGTEDESYRLIRGFAKGRKLNQAGDDLSRLYAVESLYTLTGANADHRLRVQPSQILPFAHRLGVEILKQAGEPLNAGAKLLKGNEAWAVECAKDLISAGKGAVVLAGPRQPLGVHLIAMAINATLGSEAMSLVPVPDLKEGTITELSQSIKANQVETLVIVGGNPSYNAPVDLGPIKASQVYRLGYYEDETFDDSTWHYPMAHFLESWGDARTGDGTLVSIQPLIQPLFNGISDIEFLAYIAGSASTRGYDLVRETFKGTGASIDENAWKKFLHDGFVANSAPKPLSASLNAGTFSTTQIGAASAPAAGQYEVVFYRDAKVDDGRDNNNGWLQELPDAVSKTVWENMIVISLATAQAMDLEMLNSHRFGRTFKREPHDFASNDRGVIWANDILELTLNGRKVQGPAWVQPGMADNTIGIAVGYGRRKTGRVGFRSGFDAYSLRTSTAPWQASGATLTKTGKSIRVVTTQEHGAMEGRPIIREANLDQYRAKPNFAKNMDLDAHAPNAGPIFVHPYNSHPELKSTVHAWGMSIDLNSCVGCNACVIACQSENNVPIVGKDQVERSREMHWMRIDRYYAGDVKDPQAASQPMLCQHCESAPCEAVCPVNATIHDEEGVNVMAYNRCVGTRYCSNNCAWKVRRFNFFDFNKRPNDYAQFVNGPLFKNAGKLYMGPLAKREPLEYDMIRMLKNPDVTVRMRGVMEKCTFCIQRIEQAKISQKVKAGASGDVRVPEGTFTTACAQACPAEAIVFGNLLDPESKVSKLKTQERNYAVLGFLDTKPRTTYLARVRNPNKAMPGYEESPASMQEYIGKDNLSPFEGEHEAEGHEHTHVHAGGAEAAHEPAKGAR